MCAHACTRACTQGSDYITNKQCSVECVPHRTCHGSVGHVIIIILISSSTGSSPSLITEQKGWIYGTEKFLHTLNKYLRQAMSLHVTIIPFYVLWF